MVSLQYCFFMHLQRSSLRKNLGQWSQGKDFIPVWVLQCFFRSWTTVNDLGHQSQGNGFSPVCVLLWVFKFWTSEKDFGHTLPGKDFHKSFWENCESLPCLLIKTFETYRKKKLINLKIIWIRISTHEIDKEIFFKSLKFTVFWISNNWNW